MKHSQGEDNLAQKEEKVPQAEVTQHWSFGRIIIFQSFSYFLWFWLCLQNNLLIIVWLPAQIYLQEGNVLAGTIVTPQPLTLTSLEHPVLPIPLSFPSFTLLLIQLSFHELFQNVGLPFANILYSLVFLSFLLIHMIKSKLWMNHNYLFTFAPKLLNSGEGCLKIFAKFMIANFR